MLLCLSSGTFIDKDLSFTPLVNRYAQLNNLSLPVTKECLPEFPICNEFMSLNLQSNGIWYNKYPVGLAVLELPFFLFADLYTQITGGIRNGLSGPYQLSVIISGMFYFVFGLFLTYKVLRRRFTEKLTVGLLVFLIAGTNILHYAVYEPSMSHIYSFFFISMVIFLLDKYLVKPTNKLIVFIGIGIAFITLIRNINIVFAVIPIFLIVKSAVPSNKLNTLLKIILIWGIISIIIFIPQMLYWKMSTGGFIAYGYSMESFDFLHPHIFEFLFDMKSNGLFFWHPLLILIIPGSYYWIKSKDRLGSISIIFLLFLVYILSSWWAYWFGYSFGNRAFTDYYLLFLIPIGYLGKRLSRLKRPIFVVIISITLVLFLALNLIQMNNYWRSVVASHNLTWENYWEHFGQPYLGRL